MTRSSAHDTFVIERDYEAAPDRVFAAWAEKDAKERWFGPGDEHEFDFREGGREFLRMGDWTYDARYEDVVPGERIVFGYVMHNSGRRVSASLTTVEFVERAGGGTHMRYTEQGVFLDGEDRPEVRAHGTEELLDKLGAALAAGAPA